MCDVPLVERLISRNIPGTCISVNVAFNLKIVIVKYICVLPAIQQTVFLVVDLDKSKGVYGVIFWKQI